MLQFFRKYQKFFFLFITIVIVTTFVFFGTYQAISPAWKKSSEEKASYESLMARFLDTEQWMVSRKVFGANFLNDGVISKEFLETKMADLVVQRAEQRFQEDFATRFEKEKLYKPYVHPHLPGLSAEAMWSLYAPEIPLKLKAHQRGKGAFEERKALFLAQKQFPPAHLSQALLYQQHNNPRVPSDPRLAKDETALFGYQSLSDWFGEAFVEEVSKVLIQTASVARKLGYKVSKDELMTELAMRAQETYKGVKQSVELPVQNGYGFFQLYLSQIGLNEQQALRIWEDITLFRRLMHEVGAAAVADTLPLSQFYAFAYENATIELYQMASDCKLTSLEDLKKLEAYLAAVGNGYKPLTIPQDYAPLATIETRAPALIGKRYQLAFAKTSKKALEAKVSLKETLAWECEPLNWETLKHQFPELAQKTGIPFEILEKMEPKGKKLIDGFARKQIVEAHPEWIEETLAQAELEEKEIFLSSASLKPFEGIENVASFMAALETQTEFSGYTQDQTTYYRFQVMQRGENKEVLSYKQARAEGILDKLLQPMHADELVQKVVEACPKEYRDMAWSYRFAPFMAQYKETPPVGALAKQFLIEKKEKTITRSETNLVSLNEALALEKGAFSSVKVNLLEGAYFYRLVEHKHDTTLPLDKMVQAQDLLSKEARCRYFENLLEQFKEADA